MQKKTTKIHIHPTDIAQWEYCNIQWFLKIKEMKKNQRSKRNSKSGSSRQANQIDTSQQRGFRNDTNET